MTIGRRVRLWILQGALVLAGAAPGCGDLLQEPDTGIATLVDLVRVSGNGQSGEPGTTLPPSPADTRPYRLDRVQFGS